MDNYLVLIIVYIHIGIWLEVTMLMATMIAFADYQNQHTNGRFGMQEYSKRYTVI